MAKSTTYDGTTLTTVRPDSVQIVEAAHLGDVGTGGMVLDDSDGALIPVGFKAVLVTESSAPANNRRLLSGRAADRKFRRGQFQVAAGREIDVTLLDANVLLGDHVIWNTDGNRAAETISARLTWLLGTSYVAFHDNGYVVYSTTAMDANDYRGQTPGDVIFDCANAVGFNYFIYYDETAAQYSLFFLNSNTSTSYSTTTKISNVAADADGTTVLSPLQDAELTRDPAKVALGVLVPYAKGSTYRTLASTATNFTSRDMVATTATIKTLAKAQALGDRLLTDNSEEDDSITCSVWVLPANVNDIRAGHLLQAKFSHLPGYESYRWMRVLRRTVSQPQNTDFRYQVDLELSPAAPVSPVSSFATIYYPAEDHDSTTLPTVSNPMQFRYTGDVPGSTGYLPNPKYGLVSYDATGAISGLYNTGIKVTGGGTDVEVFLGVDWQFAYDFGAPAGGSMRLDLLKNGVSIANTSVADPGSGLHSFAGTLTIDKTAITVVSGDIFTAKMTWVNQPHISSIPSAGTFAYPYLMQLTGTLA